MNGAKILSKRHLRSILGIEVGCFWNMAEKSRLWERGTYGSPMSQALEKLTTVKAVKGDNGEILFYAFELK